MSDRPNRSTYTETRRMRSSGKEDNEEAEERGPHLGGDTSSHQKPPHRYRRAVGQAVAFTTELE